MTGTPDSRDGREADAAEPAAAPPADDAQRQVKLSDHVYERIFELIVSGEYPTNSRLPSETDLAERFKVSRPIVREALGRLRDDQLVVSRQGSGSYVQRRPDTATLGFGPLGSIADIQRCYEFREAIEGACAAIAAQRRSSDDMALLEDLVARLDDAVRSGTLGAETDFSFHLAVAEAARNRFFLTALRSLEQHAAFGIRLARSLSLARPRDRLLEVQREHEEICAAIRRQQPDAAREAMVAHLRNARHRVFEGTTGAEY